MPAKPPRLGHDELQHTLERAITRDPGVERVAVVGIGAREGRHPDRLGIPHHLEDGIEIVVVQIPQLDLAHRPHGSEAARISPRRAGCGIRLGTGAVALAVGRR